MQYDFSAETKKARQSWVWHGVALFMLGAFQLGSHVIAQNAIDAGERYATLINASGQQAMLSQKILHLAHLSHEHGDHAHHGEEVHAHDIEPNHSSASPGAHGSHGQHAHEDHGDDHAYHDHDDQTHHGHETVPAPSPVEGTLEAANADISSLEPAGSTVAQLNEAIE